MRGETDLMWPNIQKINSNSPQNFETTRLRWKVSKSNTEYYFKSFTLSYFYLSVNVFLDGGASLERIYEQGEKSHIPLTNSLQKVVYELKYGRTGGCPH
jgi:hypothetical protein